LTPHTHFPPLSPRATTNARAYEEESGKGGYHRIYYPKMDRKQFNEHTTKTITDKLHEAFRY
jgi:hypothetical protein